ncbi:MAG: [FeFe] hydrogenase H-cluster maturation GTPase HydF [Spirochaetes bacterium]|nr:[FeFe] hydrogenase H-cluster maturation GTPase HydF [Spirochaetota bacterium]
MRQTPTGLRTHIGLFGRRNVGKSSLLNALVHQEVSIVSNEPGTTTDPVEKPMELKPIGPVLFIDTAGIDDEGELGERRVAKTRATLDRTDLALLITDGGAWGPHEAELYKTLHARGTPLVIVHNKVDLPAAGKPNGMPDATTVWASAKTGAGLDALREAMHSVKARRGIAAAPLAGDLVGPGELAVMVIPIDQEAPAGRLILPQAQTLRDLLDSDAMTLVVKERELRGALAALARPPRLVITDSQAFLKVAADVPEEIPLTSFSILFSRFKGDLLRQVEGALAVDGLRAGDRILIAEACAHHPVGEDIGRVKIPRWLTQYVGGALRIDHVQGHDFPEDLSPYRLVIHCGACTMGAKELGGRIERCAAMGVPITNYGLVIAYSLGIFERALGPFPAALERYRNAVEARRNLGKPQFQPPTPALEIAHG